ncbi:MAG: amylo-alpha-1,6-glucosidase [Spirochaetes bacterium]|nr:amylo-alpha-1,6-glucosidase [Spirochaetota bacterium]
MTFFSKSLLSNDHISSFKEYLVTNGSGSYCAGAINQQLSRGFHGLLVSSFQPPINRYLLLHKIEETLIDPVSEKTICSSQQKNNPYLDSFYRFPLPTWTYSTEGLQLEKKLFMPHEQEKVVLCYQLSGIPEKEVILRLEFICNFRKFDEYSTRQTLKKNTPQILSQSKQITIQYPGISLWVSFSHSFQNFLQFQEMKTSDYQLDHNYCGIKKNEYSLMTFSVDLSLSNDQQYFITISNQPNPIAAQELLLLERQRQKKLTYHCPKDKQILKDLLLAADQFIVNRKSIGGKTILAGYPWFFDWGRDSMIAFTGLTLCTRRFDEARSILKTFAHYCNQGMLPNKFPDWPDEKIKYNTIDASLWFFYAVDKFVTYTKDHDFIKKEIYPALKKILQAYYKGTRYGISMDEDGLVTGGDENTQLTWMDVKYQGVAITPRYGKAVEINALWYNALKIMEKLSSEFGDSITWLKSVILKVEENYIPFFWNQKQNCLYDYVAENKPNEQIRPNQIFSVSLPYSLLNRKQAMLVVNQVREKLWTPLGLRSLADEDAGYQGIYQGNLKQRDYCYHQGTVWSWLAGHFVTAYQKVYQNPWQAKKFLEGLIQHFYQDGCIGSISEVFDGNPPHTARGCFAQAWSVGELIRTLVEDCGELDEEQR